MSDSRGCNESEDTGHRPAPYFTSMSAIGSLQEIEPLLDTVFHAPCVVYTGRLMADGEYRELVSGPQHGLLLGGDVEGADASLIWESAVHPDDWEIYTGTHSDLRAQIPTAIEYRLVGLDGVTRWVLERTMPRHVDGDSVIFDGVVMEITELRSRLDALQARLAQADEHAIALERARLAAETRARVDDLTGLHNRRHFTELLYRQVLRCGLTGDPVAVLMLDIDHFKSINDAHGHLVGDAALAAAAYRLRKAIRPTDVLARWGGEEFVVLLPSVHDAETLQNRAEELRQAISGTPLSVGTAVVEMRISIGGACRTVSRTDGSVLLEEADKAMYEAKSAGRDRVVVAGLG
jgi:diguanylate cyclase (GGDEF)-like protein